MSDAVSGLKSVFGGSGSTGMLGTGRFQAKEYNINDAAFDPTKLKSYKQEQDARGQQSQFIQMLQNQANGIGPSLAQQQLKMGTDRGIAQQMGVAASQRGVNPAMAARMAMQNAAGINQQGAADAAMIREQEKLNATSQLGAQIGSLRQGDLAATDRDLSAKMGRESLGVQQQTGLNNTNAGAFEGAASRRGNLVSGLGSAAAALSDEANKTEVKDGASKTKGFLDKISESLNKLNSKDDGTDSVIEKGNIDLINRPRVKNADGSISTVRSMGINVDGQEVLIPTVSEDGRVMDDDEAVEQFRRTGRHLGKFRSAEASTRYAENLHNDQAELIKKHGTFGNTSGASGFAKLAPMITKAGAAAPAAASDEKNKKDVKSGDKKSEGFLNSIRSAMGRPTISDEKQKETEGKNLGEQIANSIFKVKAANAAQSTSDEDKKTKTGSGKGELQGFLDAIGAHSYEYKDEMKDNPLAGEGEFVSPMAQELEKTEVGKSMVMDTPDGKVVDYGKGFGAILAAQAMLNDRLNKIEKRKQA